MMKLVDNDKSAAKKICECAKIEYNEQERQKTFRAKKFRKCDKEGVGIIEKNVYDIAGKYYIVNIYDKPVSLKDWKNMDKDIRATSGFYTLRYLPKTDYMRNDKFPYVLGQDLVRIRIVLANFRHLLYTGRRIPEIAWLVRNSYISPKLFLIARKHPGVAIRFTVNVEEYCDKIEKAAEELGIDIDNKPLGSIVSNKQTQSENEDKIIPAYSNDKDYEKEIAEIYDDSIKY